MMRSRAFTIIELLVVIGIIGVLLAILLPTMEKVRHRAYIDSCASNLRQVGQALAMYANDNNGAYPRAIYDPATADAGTTTGNNFDSPKFVSGSLVANDVTEAIYLLLKTEGLSATLFMCPYNDVVIYQADTADPAQHSNFTDWKKNLGYSFANMYPSVAAVKSGYKWGVGLSANFAVAADLNPGMHPPRDDVVGVKPTSDNNDREEGNSPNHEKEGQNVLYGDGHVVFENTCLVGAGGDNIYTNKSSQVNASPIDANDSVLLPAAANP